LHKRDGFDNQVNLTFAGMPKNSNIQVQNAPIPKGKNEQLLRIFVNNNAKVGTYTLYLASQGQVSYSRNPQRAERAKAAQAEADAALKSAQEQLNKTKQDFDAASKQFAAAQATEKQAEAAKNEAEKKLQPARDAVQAAETEKQQAEQKLAEAKTAAEQDAAKEPARQQAEDALAAAVKKLADAQAAAKKTEEELAAAQRALDAARANVKTMEEARAKAEAAVKPAEQAVQSADARKKTADKELKDAQNAAKPKNVNVFSPSTPIVLTIKPGPATLSAAVPNGGRIKRGEKLDVKVTVNRINGFTGPVTLALPLPPNVQGLTAAEVTIPADQKEGVLSIQAAADATEGQLANMVIRGTMEFNGKAAVDAPIN
ncbi:MAG: hypothetical protein ACREIV_14240, partial [Planctomycetaceae bacterium]